MASRPPVRPESGELISTVPTVKVSTKSEEDNLEDSDESEGRAHLSRFPEMKVPEIRLTQSLGALPDEDVDVPYLDFERHESAETRHSGEFLPTPESHGDGLLDCSPRQSAPNITKDILSGNSMSPPRARRQTTLTPQPTYESKSLRKSRSKQRRKLMRSSTTSRSIMEFVDELHLDFKDILRRRQEWRKATYQTSILGFIAIALFVIVHYYLSVDGHDNDPYLLSGFYLLTWISMVCSLVYHILVAPMLKYTQVEALEAAPQTVQKLDKWGKVANLHYITDRDGILPLLRTISGFENWTEKNTKFVHFHPDDRSGTCVFMAHHHKSVIVCFRGTKTRDDVQVDLDVGFCQPLYIKHITDYLHQKYKTDNFKRFSEQKCSTDDKASRLFALLPLLERIRIHTGFNMRYEHVRSDVLDFVAQAVENGARNVMFTGHSLGGACATISAVDYALTHAIRSVYAQDLTQVRIQTITFGAPRCGNESLAAAVCKLFPNGRAKRVKNDQDLICSLPHPAVGFLHRNQHFLVAIVVQYLYRHLIEDIIRHLGGGGSSGTGEFFSRLYQKLLALQVIFLLVLIFVPSICRIQFGKEGLFRHCGTADYILFQNGQVWENPKRWMKELHELQAPLAFLEFGKSLSQHKMKNYVKVLQVASKRSAMASLRTRQPSWLTSSLEAMKDPIRMTAFAKRLAVLLVVWFSRDTAWTYFNRGFNEIAWLTSGKIMG